MSKPGSRLHMIETGIEWAEPHRVGQVRDGDIRGPCKASGQATEHPCCGEVWAELERPIDKNQTTIELTGNDAQPVSAPRERNGVVLAKFNCSLS